MSENQTNSTGLTTKKKEQRSKTPKWIGRYQILGEAGRGATAFVYKAYDPQLDRHLAIKVLRQELANNDEYREAFLREAKLAAQLTHPGIVTTYDVGIADNKPYIAMELLEGYTLQYILKTHGKVDIQQLLDMAEQLSRALAYAHKQGVVHRDLKPGNIIILNDKKTVKLTDFGIAHLDDSLGSDILQTDKVLGTPEYMAPEQLLGKPMDKRSDLYSFGVLLYQLILGKPPFTNTDLGLLFKQVIRDKPPILMLKYAIADENITDDLSDLVRKLLQKNPNKRYQTASDVAVELNAIQNKSGSGKIKSTKGFISLRLRWTAIMASVMFIAICISLAVVYRVQKQALSGITSDYGHSIARMIAFESSEAILLEDNIRLNVLVAESSKNEQLENIYVMGVNNTILTSTKTDFIGKQFQPPVDRELIQTLEKSKVYQHKLSNDQLLLGIEMPILYADKIIGNLYVSYNVDSMYEASRTTLVSMLMVMMVTLFIVFIVTFLLARQTTNIFLRVTQALNKMATGRIDARLISEENDEVGQLFGAFNFLAQYLENRLEFPLDQEHNAEADNNISINNQSASIKGTTDKTLKLNVETKNDSTQK